MKNNDAIFSDDRTYRYALWRIWEPSIFEQDKGMVMFIGLNPSTANEIINDPTITREIGFAKSWGYSGLIKTNLFAFRSPKPKIMKAAINPVGPDNNAWLKNLSRVADLIMAAWGVDGHYNNRDEIVCNMIDNLHCLSLTKEGFPGHPLYLKKDLRPIPYRLKV